MYSINSQPLAVLKLFPWAYHICKKVFRKKLPVICKNKKTKAKFYFLPSKLKLYHKKWFNSYNSSKTHTGDKKAISVSLPKPQEHTFTSWREIAYVHWAHPGQRSHISPNDFLDWKNLTFNVINKIYYRRPRGPQKRGARSTYYICYYC